MANVMYPKGKQKYLAGDIDMENDTIMIAMLSIGGSAYNAADEFWAAIEAHNGSSPAPVQMTGITVTNGVFDAANTLFTAASGDPTDAFAIYKDTGNSATSPLIAYLDTAGSGAFSIVLNGGNVTIQWDNGANKIFTL